jgi:hypothetical protein
MAGSPPWLLCFVVGLLAAAAGCGLEPRFLTPPPPADTGMALWLAENTPPPAGYAPVTLGDPPLGICRVFVHHPPDAERKTAGYITGEAAADTCRLSAWGALLTRSEQFELLYVRDGLSYSWASRDELRPDLPYQRSRLWANNAVPVEPMRYADGSYDAAWLPCAAQLDGRWRVGKLALNDAAEFARCYLPGETGEIGVRPAYRALYIPLDQ